MVRSLVWALVLLAGTPVAAQFAERSALAGSGAAGVDVSGRSVKNPRVRAIHTTDPSLLGGTAHLFAKDPFLAYQLGRNLNFREFRERDGTFAAASDQLVSGISGLGGPMADDTTAKITANNQTSCAGCHNQPYGNAGGGANFAKDSGRGRSSPHYFGGGILEMLALQVREQLLVALDTDGDGWVSSAEAASGPDPVTVVPRPGAAPISFGSPKLDPITGRPGLNNHLKVFYVDDGGTWISGALGVDGVTTHGYNFELMVYGWGQGIERVLENEASGFERLVGGGATNPTLRAFYWDPAFAHSGLQSHDPTTFDDPENDGVSVPSQAGAIQFPALHQPPDSGPAVGGGGGVSPFSAGDPDNDGHLTEISEGDLDLAEWFMLNAPRPAFAGTTAQYDAGVALMDQMQCTTCHVADWRIERKSTRPKLSAHVVMEGGSPSFTGPDRPRYSGDRRFFDLDVTWNDGAGQLEGELVPLYTVNGRGDHVRRFGRFDVVGLFSDLIQHDMGEGFAELAYDSSIQTLWRTAPLWGVGSGFPWGHDGASLTLEDAILRHDGEGASSKAAWLAASDVDQEGLIDFLRRLVLYDVESLPSDIDGDGVIASNFVVAGVGTGTERFNAEWLFDTPVQIQGRFLNADGVPITSYAATNLTAAYGLDLPLRLDSDLDGWPDVWDPDPLLPGFKTGAP
jgi:hypothetical protein